MKFWAVLAVFAALGAGIWAAEQKPVASNPPRRSSSRYRRTSPLASRSMSRGSTCCTPSPIAKGRFVTNLTKDDFEVIDSKKPQSILEFNAESDLPLRLGILIDTSNSIRDRFKFEQDAAIEFLNNITPRQSGPRHAGQLRHQRRTGQPT